MGNPLAVLIVEDSDSDAQLIVRLLKKAGYEVTFQIVETAAQMRAALAQETWDIVISDYSLPQFDGPAALRLLQETGLDLPFIAVSGTMGEATAVAMMKAGAHDYLMKDNLARLTPAVERELAQAEVRRKRRQAEMALQESEARYRAIVEDLPVLICRFLPDGTLTFVNDTYCRYFDKSPAELIGHSFTPLIPEEDQAYVRQQFGSLSPAQPTAAYEHRVITPDGAVRWQRWIDRAVFDGDRLVEFQSIGEDITARQQAEQELRDSKALIEAVVENVPLMIFLKEATDLRFVLFNRAGEELLGYDRQRLLGQNNLDLFPAEQAAFFTAKDREVLDGEADVLDIPEEPIMTARQGQRLLHTRKVCIRGTDGTTKYLLGISEDITERKQGEDALRRAASEYRTLAENLPDLLARFDSGLRHIYVNPAAARAGVLSAEQYLGKTIAESGVPAPLAQGWDDRIRAVFLTGKPIEVETQFVTPDGPRFFYTTLIPERAKDGSVRSVLSIARDITERKRAEEALRYERDFAEGLIETAQTIVLVLDTQGRIVRFNPYMEEISGYALAEAQGKDWFTTFLPERDRERMRRLFLNAIGGIQTRGNVNPIVTKDGREREIEWYDKALKDAQGNVAGLLAIAQDITERKQAEEEIRTLNAELERRVIERTAELDRQRERERAILDAMGEGVVFTDRVGTIEYINPAMERLTGFTAQESVGQNARIWQSGQTPPAIYQQMWAAISRGEMWQGEMVNRHQAGRLYEAALTAAPLTNPAGQIAGFVGVQRDITRQKELDRLKDKFVSNVSHELRTPLTSILLNLDLLDYGKPDKRAHYLATLHREAERLRQMIEDLLDISRLDRETVPVELAPIDLHQLLEPLVADQATVAVERGLTLEFLPTAESLLALAEAGMLMQVVSNLITNALNYTPAGGNVTVQTHRQRAAAQDWITLTVRDTGPGIAAHDLPHVFERFYRGEVGRKASAPGTGLGLAISKEIMEKLGGRITVESQPGQGTAFTVWLRPPP